MAVIVLTSASGSPGVTATALGLALAWPRPVLLVEADPTGGSATLAGYFRGTLAPTPGLIGLALAHREGRLDTELPAAAMPIPQHDAMLLPGVRSHAQARSLTPIWEPLLAALRGLGRTGQDVIVDAGRLGLTGSPEPLIHGADLTLLTARTDLVSLSAARSWAATLRDERTAHGTEAGLGLLLLGEGRPYAAREVSKVLRLPTVATLAWDPDGAAVFSHGATPPRRFDTSGYARSLGAVRSAIATHLSPDDAPDVDPGTSQVVETVTS